MVQDGFPRLYAAASLKPVYGDCMNACIGRFPRLYAAASLKLGHEQLEVLELRLISAALCRGLIEARGPRRGWRRVRRGFPRLYAAASLKQAALGSGWRFDAGISAALCRGLIEAGRSAASSRLGSRFPRLYAAASLKRTGTASLARAC